MLTHPAPLRALVLASVVALLPVLRSQTAPVPSAIAAAKSEQAITLSEFNVTADDNRGYVPAETMTGSRVATKIIDLPYTVNVLTSEFFEDFGIFELSDNIVQIGGFTGLDVGGQFNLRGFNSTSQLRDGFFRLGRYGSSNVDRIEIIKGSNAAIYGRTSPGGMMNMISKQPKSRASQKLTFNYGNNGTQRVTLEATGPLASSSLGQTSYILTGSHYQKEFDMEYARNRNQEYYFGLKHAFNDGSTVFVSLEYFLQVRHSPDQPAVLITDRKGTASTLDDQAIGYAVNLSRTNPYGPVSQLDRGNTGLNAFYDKKLSSVFSARLGANRYWARRWDYNSNTGWGAIAINPAPATNGTLPAITSARGATPTTSRIVEDGGGFQGDLLAHYWTNDKKIEHRTLLTADINDYYRFDPALNYAGATNPDLVAWNAVRTVTLNPVTLTPVGPVAYFTKKFDSTQTVKTRSQKRRNTVFGGLLRQQTSFFSGRLLTFAGVRYDNVRFRDRDLFGFAGYITGTQVDKDVDFVKPNAGFNYKVTPGFRVYGSYSQSYFVAQGDNTQVHLDPKFKSEAADGWDYGFKGELLDSRLTYTVSGFYANRHNVSVTDNIETPLGSGNYVLTSVRDGDQLVRGYEIDVTWRISDTLSAGGSWGHVYSIYTDFGSGSPAAIGRRVNNISPQNGGAYVKFAPPSGAWRNFSANLGVSYVAATPTEAPNAGDTYATLANGQRVVTSSTNQWRLRAPSFNLWNLGLRYRLPNTGSIGHSVALNVNNLFDREYLRVNRLIGEPRAVYFSYTFNHGGKK